MQENNLISIQEISALLKVAKPTLRFWEKEFEGILVPLRTRGGQRRYTVGSLFEVLTLTEIFKRRNLFDEKHAIDIRKQAEIIDRKLHGLINSLRGR